MVLQSSFKSVFALSLLVLSTSLSCSAAPVSEEKPGKAVANSASSLLLAERGQAKYVIALAQDAIPAEKTAAVDLVNYLHQISGARFVVKNENEVPDGAPQILVGAGLRARRLLPLQRWESLGSDGIVIKTQEPISFWRAGVPGVRYMQFTRFWKIRWAFVGGRQLRARCLARARFLLSHRAPFMCR